MFEDAHRLLEAESPATGDALEILKSVGFSDCQAAHRRLLDICIDSETKSGLAKCLRVLMTALSEAATADGSLINFERFVQSVSDRAVLLRYLAGNPRAVEILVRLFVGSQFLTEILLRNPGYLERLTNHKRVAEFKNRAQFLEEAFGATANSESITEKLDTLRRFQHWELLRIGACDSFRLLDLKSVTVQLSLLADSLVQSCLQFLSEELGVDPDGFAILAFGKLGGEELNYSSDIDLVFLTQENSTPYWPLAQRLIKALMESTAEGFLYRVDMRLRPWGRSGALVNTVDAHLNYLKKHGMHWEKQALLKARVIAGSVAVASTFLSRAENVIYGLPSEVVRESIRDMKGRIEAGLKKKGRNWGEVKSGEGSIRDIEFITQGMQLIHGKNNPDVRSPNTLDGLVRLADLGYLHADEYRQLSSGYVFLRTIEHSLQLMHHKQTHSLPSDRRELAYLSRRLDFPDVDQFLTHYHQHCEAIRAIYDRHISGEGYPTQVSAEQVSGRIPDHRADMEPSYSTTFNEEEISRHALMLKKLSNENIVEVYAAPEDHGRWTITVVGFDHPGDLSRICGLLFVYGFNIVHGYVFTAEQVTSEQSHTQNSETANVDATAAERSFVNVFTIVPPLDSVLPEVWPRYRQDLERLQKLVRAGKSRTAQGRLAKRVAGALRVEPDADTTLFPVKVSIDNETSENSTVLEIESEDTIGFLYELSNAMALAEINVVHVIANITGDTVRDTIYVTNQDGDKITAPERQNELRAAIVLIKHFTHLLPRSPNPEAALLHFQDFLEHLFQQPNWLEELSSLQDSAVLDALAQLLGVSNFLWEDFLRLQHANLFPVVKDIESLAISKDKQQLQTEFAAELKPPTNVEQKRAALNAFKDREMFRADMRHILGHITEFGQFSAELTDVAEVVVEAAYEICNESLMRRFGVPRLTDSEPCPLTICALGKCGGRELGFASDIELMFVYDGNGQTDGSEVITASEFYQKLVEAFTKMIEARREGIFQIDLRLRPYGRAGSLAVSADAFRAYFTVGGAAWPYERQALVKLRPIAGDRELGDKVVALRDELIYSGEPFDTASMRAMREKQVTQLVKAGTVNAKLSPGFLVDCEYLVQGLQITHGGATSSLRTTNSCDAMDALCAAEILSVNEHRHLREAYEFLRRLIDALRMVRGHAKDLTVPKSDTEEFEYLSRRLGYSRHFDKLRDDLERYSAWVIELGNLLEQLPSADTDQQT